MGYVYILSSSNGRFYIGSTSDLDRRLEQHFSGQTPTTKRMTSLKLIFSQKFGSLIEARSVERKLKNLKRKDYIEKIIKAGYIKLMPE